MLPVSLATKSRATVSVGNSCAEEIAPPAGSTIRPLQTFNFTTFFGLKMSGNEAPLHLNHW